MLPEEFKKPSAAKRGWPVHEWLRSVQVDMAGRIGEYNALTLMLCVLGPFREVVATNIVVRYWEETGEARATHVGFTPGLGIWVECQDPRWKEPDVVVRLDKGIGIRTYTLQGYVWCPSRTCVCRCVLAHVGGIPMQGRAAEWRYAAGNYAREYGFASLWVPANVSGHISRCEGGIHPRRIPTKSMPVWLRRAGYSTRDITDTCGWVHPDRNGCLQPLCFYGGGHANADKAESAAQAAAVFAAFHF